MPRSPSRAPAVWRLVFVALGAAFTFLVLFSPLSSIYAGASLPLYLDPFQVRMGIPVILKNQPASSSRPGLLLITEVLYNPAGREPDGEWVELYNAGGRPVDLTGYKIGDQALPGCCEGMLAFPEGAILKPGQVIIIAYKASAFEAVYRFKPDYEMESSDPAVAVLSRYTAWAERSVELTNSGDDLLVLGPSDQVVDAVSWGSSTFAFDPSVPNVLEGASLERYPPYLDSDSALDWRKQASPRPGEVDLSLPTATPGPSALPTLAASPTPTLVPTPFGGKLLLSEFMYNPLSQLEKEPDGEWIEIYNAGPAALNLQDFKLGDEETRGQGEGMLRFPAGAVLHPGQAIVVANKGTAFFSKYGDLPDYEIANSISDLPDMLAYATWGTAALQLQNDGDELLILDGRDQVIDYLSYGSSTFFFSPSIPLSAEGCSLERFPGDQDTNKASDWRQQCQPSPGQAALLPPPPPTPVPVLVINEIHHAPDNVLGDANGDHVADLYDDEFVEIVNLTGAPVNLEGWRLWDGLTYRHAFPSPSWIPDHCSVVVFGGGSLDGSFGGSLSQVSSTGALSLNDTGDTLSLKDASGTPVLSVTYSGGVDGESLLRYPEFSGETFIPHSSVLESGSRLFSPGTYLDGSPFPGCSSGD